MPTLYLCRHAVAQDAIGDMTDAQRPLSPFGVEMFRPAARNLVKLIGAANIFHLLSSPLLRARQTADIIAEAMLAEGKKMPVKICPALATHDRARSLLKFLGTLKHPDGIIAVGHEPTLAAWIGELCFDNPGRVRMKKGAVAAIELEGRHGELLWLLQPAMLRDL